MKQLSVSSDTSK
ncbi:hypothetical protein Tco_0506978, partial [Tanacetum coccineum]